MSGSLAMAGLDPATHAAPHRKRVRLGTKRCIVEGRVKPGHDIDDVTPGSPTHD